MKTKLKYGMANLFLLFNCFSLVASIFFYDALFAFSARARELQLFVGRKVCIQLLLDRYLNQPAVFSGK